MEVKTRFIKTFGALLIAALLFAAVPAGEVRAQTAPIINHGTFGGAPYAREDLNAVNDFKNESFAIQAGGYTSDTEFHTLEGTIISFDGHSTYVTDRGGCIYIQTVITGLQAGDIVEIDNNSFEDMNDGAGFYSFWDQDPYWMEIGDYTHKSKDTILNWLIYSEKVSDTEYRLVVGSGVYELAENTDDLTSYIGWMLRLTRDIKIYRGETLTNPETSSRGYIYSNTEDTSTWGAPIASDSLDTGGLTYVGVQNSYVDDDWVGSDNGDLVGNNYIFGQDAFATIQQAIDATANGGTVNVAAGTYSGAVVDKGVIIRGAEDGSSIITSGVEYKVGGAYTTAFRVDEGADGAEIYNFTVNNDQAVNFYFGVFAKGVDDIIIDGFTINDAVQGITNWGGSDWEITNNKINSTVAAGGGGIGIFLGALPLNYPTCSNNLVQYNEIDATATAESYTCAGIAVALDTRYGGYDELNGTEDISGNQILDNTITAAGVNNGVGIEVGTILGDSEGDPDRTDPLKIAAIMADAAVHNNTVQGNTADGTETGIYFYNVTDLTITQNTIENSVGDGVLAEHGQSGTSISNNTFLNNEVQLTDETVDTDNLDPLDIESILGNNTFDRAVTVDHPGNSLLHVIWSGIQDAIDAASPGDTILVNPGTYSEKNIVIDKSLTILGDPGDENPGPGVNAPIVDGGSEVGDAFKIANGVSEVVIKGFVMQNYASSSNGIGNGISAWQESTSNITIQDNHFRNLGWNGVLVGNDGALGDHTNWTIKSNILETWALYGFELTNTSASVIEDNIITADITRSPETAIAVIARRDESGITIQRNKVFGQMDYSLDPILIFAWDADGYGNPTLDNVVVRDNVLEIDNLNYEQIFVWELNGTITNVDISLNQLDSLNNATTSTLSASPNWWGSILGPQSLQIVGDVDYDPWCGDPACSFTVSANEGDGDYYINAAGQIVLSGNVNVGGGIIINEPGLTFLLTDGTIIENNSPCFVINADYTKITTESPGGATCVPTAGSNGIDVAAGLTDIIIEGLEINGTGQSTGDGIHFAGGITDVILRDNFIHDLDGDGVEFTTAPAGTVQVQGNLFMDNFGVGVEAPSNVDVTYNAWGHMDGPGSGDGVSTNITTIGNWTHVDLYMESSGTDVTDEVREGETITYTIYANLQQATGADFKLLFEPTLLEVSSTTLGSIFTEPAASGGQVITFDNGDGEIHFAGVPAGGDEKSGADLVLFTVTFTAKADGVSDLEFADDDFAMSPPSGPSNNIYASELTDGSVTIRNHFTVTGTVSMQGRTIRSDVSFILTSNSSLLWGPFQTLSIDQISDNVFLSQVVENEYQITIEQDRYLDLVTASGKLLDVTADMVLNPIELFGGDVNNSNAIGLDDASIVGGDYYETGDNDGDANFDDIVNIFDLALVGGNYGLESTTAYDSWTP